MKIARLAESFKGTAGLVALACVVLMALAWVYALERIAHEREDVIANVTRKNDSFVRTYEQQTIRTLHGIDQALRFLRYAYEHSGAALDPAGLLESGALYGAVVRSATIVDARGTVILSNLAAVGTNVSDRAYFKAHRDAASDRMLVSEPVTSRLDGRPVVLATRRLHAPDGSFLGVAVIGMAPEYLANFAAAPEVGAKGVIQLVGLDGVARARRVGDKVLYGTEMSGSRLLKHASESPAGRFLSRGFYEGFARYMSYRTLQEYPFIVAIGTSVDEGLAQANARRRDYYVGAALATLLLALLGGIVVAATARQRKATAERWRATARYRATFDQAAVGIAHQALDGRYLKVNRRFCNMLGYSEEELCGRSFLDYLHPGDAAASRAAMAGGVAESIGMPGHLIENRHVRKDGSIMWGSIALSAVPGSDGTPEYILAMVQDITERKQAEQALEDSRTRFRDLVDNTSDFIWETNAAIEFIYASNNINVLLGFSPEDVLGKRPFDLMPPDEAERVQAWLAPLRAAGKGFANLETVFYDVHGNLRTWETNGAPFLDSNGRLLGYRGVSRDITARKAAEATLERQAHYDALTELPNRVLCFDRLAQAITQAKRRQWNTGVLSIDLDRFKNVNDTLGHAVGDALLREAAQRLLGCVRAGDTVARVGGDEFAVVLSELSDPQDAGIVATHILEAMATPLTAGSHEVFVTASIGIAICPPDGEAGEVLLRNADAAMSRAKQLGRNNFQFYAAEMNARAMDQLVLEGQLRRALQRGEYFLHYQPKASIDRSRITGFEALLRWRRADGRVVPPGEFIPLLEDSGMIVPVGEWVIRTACAQVRAWRQAGLEALPVAVNVSAKQFHHELFEVIERALREHGVEPRMLEVEITESDAMRDPERVIRALGRLKALGVTVSIDDFGTGYSSLGYLKRFPVDKLKLDRSFVTGLPGNADDISITRAVISMAHSLGLEVVAEGVETDAQRGFLAHHRCDQMQGYLLSRPVPPEACAALLREGTLALS